MKTKINRPTMFVNAINQGLRTVQCRAGYYAIRLDEISLLLSTSAAHELGWALIQSQAKNQGKRKE